MNANVTADGGDVAAQPSSGGWLNLRSERLIWGAAAVLIATLLSISAFRGIPPLASLETTINDQLRVLIAPRGEQDKRISIVALNEETLIQFPYRSPIDRGFLAELVEALTSAGAKAIVFDVLFDQPTEVEKDEALHAAAG